MAQEIVKYVIANAKSYPKPDAKPNAYALVITGTVTKNGEPMKGNAQFTREQMRRPSFKLTANGTTVRIEIAEGIRGPKRGEGASVETLTDFVANLRK